MVQSDRASTSVLCRSKRQRFDPRPTRAFLFRIEESLIAINHRTKFHRFTKSIYQVKVILIYKFIKRMANVVPQIILMCLTGCTAFHHRVSFQVGLQLFLIQRFLERVFQNIYGQSASILPDCSSMIFIWSSILL